MTFKKYKDLILGAVTLALSIFYMIFTAKIKTRPKLTPSYSNGQIIPWLLGGLLAILSVILILQGLRKMRTFKPEDGGKAMAREDLLCVVLTFAVIVGYTVIMPILGFCLSTVIYLFLQMLVLAPAQKRNLVLFAVVAVVFTAFVFVAFRVGLQQLLPRGVIESLLGF